MSAQDKLKKAEALATKLDKLNSHFDIAESTIHELSEHIDVLVPTVDTEIDFDDRSQNIITVNLLKKDFMMIRDTLLTNISNGKTVLQAITVDLMALEGSKNSQMISAYAELVGVVNNSMKLLTSTYKDIVDIQKAVIVEEEKDKKNTGGDTNNTQINNYYGMSVSDLVEQIKQKG